MSTPRRAMFALLSVVLATVLAVVGAEAWVRSSRPQLRVQVFRVSDRMQMHDTPTGPWWQNTDSQMERVHAGCPNPAAARRVVLSGSSILYGSGLDSADSLGPALAARLDDTCVLNHAEPGTTFAPQASRLEAVLVDTPADVLVWEMWQNSPHPVNRVGDSVYNFGPLTAGLGGVPDPWGLGALNIRLLQSSRMYELAMTNAAPRHDPNVRKQWRTFTTHALPRMQAIADQAGARLVLITCPFLDKPFTEQLPHLDQAYGAMVEAADAAGVPVLDLARAFADEDPEPLRADRCCHYNEAGTQRVAELLQPLLAPQPEPPPETPAETPEETQPEPLAEAQPEQQSPPSP